MKGREDVLGKRRFDKDAPLPRHAKLPSDQRLRRGRAETDDGGRPEHRKLCVEPRPAGGELAPARLLMDPALATRPPLEVFDRVRDVREIAIDARLVEEGVEQASGRPHEGPALVILAIAG